MSQQRSGWLLLFILSLLSSLIMGLALVWLNIERVDSMYTASAYRKEIKSMRSLKAKLEVERDRLRSPHELGMRAKELGMRDAKPGQLRRVKE